MDAQSISLIITTSASAVVAILAALRLSKCTRIKCCCLDLERDSSDTTDLGRTPHRPSDGRTVEQTQP